MPCARILATAADAPMFLSSQPPLARVRAFTRRRARTHIESALFGLHVFPVRKASRARGGASGSATFDSIVATGPWRAKAPAPRIRDLWDVRRTVRTGPRTAGGGRQTVGAADGVNLDTGVC